MAKKAENNLRESLEKLQSENKSKQLDIKYFRRSRDELSERNEELEKILSNHEILISGLKTKLSVVTQEITELKQDKTQLQYDRTNLENEYASLELYLENDHLSGEPCENENSTENEILTESLKNIQDELTAIFTNSTEQNRNEIPKGPLAELKLQTPKEGFSRKLYSPTQTKIHSLTTHQLEVSTTRFSPIVAIMEGPESMDSQTQSDRDDIVKKIHNGLQALINNNNTLQKKVNKEREKCKVLSEDNFKIKERNEMELKCSLEEMKNRISELESKNQELTKQLEKERVINQEKNEKIKNLTESMEQESNMIIEKNDAILELNNEKVAIQNKFDKTEKELNNEILSVTEEYLLHRTELTKVTLELEISKSENILMKQNFEKEFSQAENNSKNTIRGLNTEINELKNQVLDFTKDKQVLRKENKSRSEEIKDLIAKIELKNKENKQEKEELEKELTGLNENLERQKSEYDYLNDNLETLQRKLEGKENELENLLTESVRDKLEIEERYNEIDEEKQTLQEEIDQLNTLISTLNENEGDLKVDLEQSNRENDNLKRELESSITIPKAIEAGKHVIPIQNPTKKTPIKLKYKGINVPAVKLEEFPEPKTHINNQTFSVLKKNLELGTLVTIFEVPTKVGKKSIQMAKFAGMRLNESVGDSDGMFYGSRMFMCEPNHGYFSPLEDVYVPVL